MKNIVLIVLVGIILFACSDKKENAMLVTGEIKNLKKGTLYLQKIQDTLLVTVDSIVLDGVSTFELSDAIESPELYFLSLDKSSDKQISFFGEEGTITINTRLDKFIYGATIKGLSNQLLLDEYNKMISQFNDKNLDLIKAEFETNKTGDSIRFDSIGKARKNLLKNRYLYTTNFAKNHGDKEVAPYLALTELANANIALLDTINNSLSTEVRASKYGEKLNKFLTEIKAKE